MRSRFDFFDSKGKEYALVTERAIRYREVTGIVTIRGEKREHIIGIELVNGVQGEGIKELGAGMQLLFREENPSIYDAGIVFDIPIRIGVPSGRVLEARK
jgi:hypothetical protein